MLVLFSHLFILSQCHVQPLISISVDFSGFSGGGELCLESLLRYVFFVFTVLSYIPFFIISVMFGYDLLTLSMHY